MIENRTSAVKSFLILNLVLIHHVLSDPPPIPTTVKSFPITTFINAKWHQTPLYLEIAEYLWDENPNWYWDFLKAAHNLESPLSEYDTESNQYHAAIDVVRSVANQLQLVLMKLVVSMHSLTPRIQAHLQIADEVLRNSACKGHTFVQVGIEVACTFTNLREKLTAENAFLHHDVETYNFDHIFPGSENSSRTVILYGDLGTEEFATYHRLLVSEARVGSIKYITRHFIKADVQRKVRLSGYGVELYLKSTEYKSQDDAPQQAQEKDCDDEEIVEGFNFKALKSKFSTLSHSLDQLRNNLLQRNEDIAQLKAWEFQDLGFQAASNIAEIQGDEALQVLQFTAQNFPMVAKTLLNQKVTDMLRTEIQHNSELLGRTINISPSDGALFVNGLFFDSDSLDLNGLVETLRTETRVLQSLHESEISGNIATAIFEQDFSSSTAQDFAIDIRDIGIIWINDIEHDPQYHRWPSSVMDLLRPTFPGMLRNIRKNLFNLVLVVDPLETNERNLIKLGESFVVHMAPVHLGFVFDTRRSNTKTNDDYVALFCAFNYISKKHNPRSALSFLTDIFASLKDSEKLTKSHLRKQLKKSFKSLSTRQVEDILTKESDFDYGRQLSLEFVHRLGFENSPQALLNGVPMQQDLLISDNDFEEAIFNEIIQQTTALQKSIYHGDLTDSDTVIDYLMNQPHIMPRLNKRILSHENNKYLDLTGSPHKHLLNVKALSELSHPDMTATLMYNTKYFSFKHGTERIGNNELHFLTLWIIADLEEGAGNELLTNALQYMKDGDSVRVAFIPNIEYEGLDCADTNKNWLVWAATQSLAAQEATEMTLTALRSPRGSKLEKAEKFNDMLPSAKLHLNMLRIYCQRVLGLRASENLVIANGKMFGPLRTGEQFSVEDFGLIERLNAFQYGDKIREIFKQHDVDNDVLATSDTLLKLYASLSTRQSKTRFKLPDNVREDHSVVKLSPKEAHLPYFYIAAVVDPASKAAQKLAPILILLRNIVNCRMRVYLTPVSQHSDMPVKNFYRYVVEPEVQFMPNGKLSEGSFAKFVGLPLNPLLTQNLQVPENWLVEAVRSVYDLDNIRLSEIGGPVHSEFELEYLLLEGHCFHSASGAPPRGLQLTLGTKTNPILVDTIVMANLGYFQLKANPGIWELRLREGKSSEIYDITDADGPNTVHAQNCTKIVLSSFRSHVIKVKVSKKSGMQHVDLLSDDDEFVQSGIWNSIANSFGGSNAGGKAESDTINIFSVASGHLYERLLRIMMVSLLKQTKTSVKFWFLKNYLSPQFTDFLPHMVLEYNFQYELVQYKWPRWLHQQTEKQRTIWGYKILFLDVLFPLNVRKIIFVDADAIVQADLKDLYNMDLGGAPYAYTPFCDSRKEMEGFRFWKQGYWRSHLMGRDYHISALYVVDLKRFRKIAAGDRLRGQYQALSQDPNSLANLDQDLPNNMIHQVTIKSLPEEWLWCETWCSNSSFKKAKVIDLCNNPLTKEAKLTAAQRIVPEWKDYDMEIKKLLAKIEEHENIEHDTLIESNKLIKEPHSDKHSEL